MRIALTSKLNYVNICLFIIFVYKQKYKDMKNEIRLEAHHGQRELQRQRDRNYFGGFLPLNHPAVQMMINERIARQEALEREMYHKGALQRKAYYYEKLIGLTARIAHHFRLCARSPKDGQLAQLLTGLQAELLILWDHKPEWATQMGLTRVILLNLL